MKTLGTLLPVGSARRHLLTLLLGASLVLAFAPFGFGWLAPVVLAGLFLLLEGLEPREAARTGFIFGLGEFAAGIWWLYISLNILGGLWPPVTVLMMCCLMAAMALYTGLTGWLAARIAPQGGAIRWLLVLPAAWTLAEWLRGWLLTGFPWLSIGYSQTDTPAGALAPLVGVYGISWAVLLAAGVLTAFVIGSRGQRLVALAAGVLLGAILVGLAGQSWTEPAGKELAVRLVQGGVSQELKWEPEQLQPTLDLYSELSFADADSDTELDLIVWPEAAIPALPFEVPEFLNQLSETAVGMGTQMFVGILTYNLQMRGYQNTLWALGEEQGMYHKRHLVIFGEYFPLPDFARHWLRIMNLPSENILPGTENQALLSAQGVPVATTICYEIVNGASQLQFFPEAELMVNVSNDAWFGEHLAPHQHFQMGRMRAMETGRYLLRATNTGITAVVDPQGHVVGRLPQLDPGALDAEVEPHTGATPYVRFGNWLVVTAMILLLLVGARVGRTGPAAS